MIKQVNGILAEIQRRYADKRTQVFSVAVENPDAGRVILSGRVLEAAQRQELLQALLAAFPAVEWVDQLQVLRGATPRRAWLAANLTGLYDEPSFLAEMLSQETNGACLEVLETQGKWQFVRQEDGYLGWVYAAYLTGDAPGEPTHLVCSPEAPVFDSPAGNALLTRLPAGTALRVEGETSARLRVQLAGGTCGWAERRDLRGFASLPREEPARRAQIAADALTLVGVPYLWGGCTAWGIDCSGFAQLLHRWVGISLPRDADLQFAAGREAQPPYREGDLLFFGESGAERKIMHVAVSLGGGRIIHASRARNGVHCENWQENPNLLAGFAGARCFV